MNTPKKKIGEKLPLACTIRNGVLKISVNAATVKFATENHPDFWEPDTDTFRYKVADQKEWLKSVARRINFELGEDGSTLLSRMFDKAIIDAIEQGDEGLVDED